MTHTRDYTSQGNMFEAFCATHVGCPTCGGSLDLLPPSFPVADLKCSLCDTWVNAKYSAKSTNRTHPQSRKAFTAFAKAHGRRALCFVVGTPDDYKVYRLGRKGVKEYRADRARGKYGRIQERVYWKFA